MKALIFQHTPEETPGTLLDWLRANRIHADIHHWHREKRAPDADHDILFVMGGPMNVHEEDKFPWLVEEKLFIRDWLHQGNPIMGICLGGQLLAEALGGKVTKAPGREAGFQEIKRTGALHPAFRRWPTSTRVYQLHQYQFSLPPECTSLLTGEGTREQAFALNDYTIGLQFHPESTGAWIRGNGPTIKPQAGENFVQDPHATNAEIRQSLPALTTNFFRMLDDFAAAI